MNKRNAAIIVGLVIVLIAGIYAGLWSRGTADRAQEKLELAVKYISENDLENAVLAYNAAIDIDPKQVKAYQGLAKVYTLQGKYDEAQAAYDKGVTAVAASDQNTLRLGLAGMYIDKGQLADAEKAFQDLINGSQNCIEAYWGLAMVYQKQGDNTKAEAVLRQAAAKYPNDYRGYNTLALFLKQNNKADDAFNNLVKSIGLEINQQEAYLVLSDLYKGNWPKLQAKLSTASNQQISAMLEFYMYYASEDYPKATNIYKSKLDGQSGNYKARILTAIAMVKTGDKTGAENIINQVLSEKINDWLLSDLALYYQVAGNNTKARLCAVQAVQANGTNLEAVALLQKLNTGDEKIYAAEFLVYNWSPVGKAKEEMAALGLPIPSVNQTDSKIVKQEQVVKKPDKQIEYGNTPGNLGNCGLAVEKDNWVYYVNRNNGDRIFKIRTDGSGHTKLNDEASGDINVSGGWIYYIHCRGCTLYKIRTDGSEQTKLCDDQAVGICNAGDWIYYVNYSDHTKLYKIRTDGSERTKVSDDSTSFINVVGDWIYYRNGSDGLRIYKVRTDGSDKMKLCDDETYIINVSGDWIYYMNSSDQRKLYKIATDGSGRVKLNNELLENVNVSGDWIYYSNRSDGDNIYKIRIDGTGRTKLNNDMSSAINVAGGWVYYDYRSESKQYKMRLDGSGQELVM